MSISNSSAGDRFKKRQRLKKSHTIYNEVDETLVHQFLNSEIDQDNVDRVFQNVESFYDVNVSRDEAEQFLIQFKKDFNDARFNQLITDCKKDIINSIVTPFGLGNIVAAYDKVGGNVTTTHNFKEGIVATESDKDRYNEWQKSIEKFDRTPYDQASVGESKGSFNQNKKKEMFKELKEGDVIVDGYTNEELGKKQGNNISKNKQIDLEHITSTKEIETNSKNHLFADGNNAEERQNYRVGLATDDSNLTLIEGSMNSSKGDRDLIEWANSKVSKQHAEETGNPNMTNAEYYNLDPKLIEEKYHQSKRELKRKEIKNQVKKQGKEILNTGVAEGGKMALQQALGLVITEFFTATFDEIIDIYKNGFYTEFNDKFLSVLKERLNRIGVKIAAKWKDVLIAAKDGFISGFISNLVTVVINAFVTTGKRVIRIIREGIYSLFRAVKVLVFPPEGMSFEDRMHEAQKLIATGLIVSIGVIVEEYVDKLIKATAVLEPFTDVLTTVLIGSITGLSITMVVYYLDKKKNDKDAIKLLLEQTENSYQNIEKMISLR